MSGGLHVPAPPLHDLLRTLYSVFVLYPLHGHPRSSFWALAPSAFQAFFVLYVCYVLTPCREYWDIRICAESTGYEVICYETPLCCPCLLHIVSVVLFVCLLLPLRGILLSRLFDQRGFVLPTRRPVFINLLLAYGASFHPYKISRVTFPCISPFHFIIGIVCFILYLIFMKQPPRYLGRQRAWSS